MMSVFLNMRPEREDESLRFAVAGVVPRHLPAVFPNDQAGDLTVGDSLDGLFKSGVVTSYCFSKNCGVY